MLTFYMLLQWGGGGTDTQNKSQHKKLTLERKIVLPLLPGIQPMTSQSQVPLSYPHSPNCTFVGGIPLVEFMDLVFSCMPGESYHRRLGSLLLYLCHVFRVLINSLVYWFCTFVGIFLLCWYWSTLLCFRSCSTGTEETNSAWKYKTFPNS